MNSTPWLHESLDFGRLLTGIGIALAVWLVAHVSLRKEERKASRLGLVLLGLFIALRALNWSVNASLGVERGVRAVEAFLYLASIGRSLMLLVTHGLWRRALGKTPPRIVLDLVQGALFISIALLSLDATGVNPTSLLATSAVLTAVLGLSLQETLGNLFAGLAIQGEQPFQVGDWIQFDQATDRAGRVLEINWRATKIVTADRVVVTVPNGVLARAPISNFSRPEPYSRRHVIVDIPYDAPAGVAKLLAEAAQRADGVCSEPKPDAVIVEFAESAVRYRVRFYIMEHSRVTEVSGGVLANALAALRRHNIFIPFPVRRVELVRGTHSQADRAEAARRREYLAKVSLVSVLSEESQDSLVELSRFVRFAKHEPIVRQGDEGDELFLVTHGLVRVQLDTGDRVTQLAMLGPGEFFGEMSLLTGEPRAASIYAEVETELIVIGHEALRTVLQNDPAAVDAIAPAVAKRQAELSEHLLSASSIYPPEASQQLIARIRSFFRIGRV